MFGVSEDATLTIPTSAAARAARRGNQREIWLVLKTLIYGVRPPWLRGAGRENETYLRFIGQPRGKANPYSSGRRQPTGRARVAGACRVLGAGVHLRGDGWSGAGAGARRRHVWRGTQPAGG